MVSLWDHSQNARSGRTRGKVQLVKYLPCKYEVPGLTGEFGCDGYTCNPWGCMDKGNGAAEKPTADRRQDTAVSTPEYLTPQETWNLPVTSLQSPCFWEAPAPPPQTLAWHTGLAVQSSAYI